jgi:hypothetical protein
LCLIRQGLANFHSRYSYQNHVNSLNNAMSSHCQPVILQVWPWHSNHSTFHTFLICRSAWYTKNISDAANLKRQLIGTLNSLARLCLHIFRRFIDNPITIKILKSQMLTTNNFSQPKWVEFGLQCGIKMYSKCFDVFTLVMKSMLVLWVKTPCKPADRNQSFGVILYFHLQLWSCSFETVVFDCKFTHCYSQQVKNWHIF